MKWPNCSAAILPTTTTLVSSSGAVIWPVVQLIDCLCDVQACSGASAQYRQRQVVRSRGTLQLPHLAKVHSNYLLYNQYLPNVGSHPPLNPGSSRAGGPWRMPAELNHTKVIAANIKSPAHGAGRYAVGFPGFVYTMHRMPTSQSTMDDRNIQVLTWKLTTEYRLTRVVSQQIRDPLSLYQVKLKRLRRYAYVQTFYGYLSSRRNENGYFAGLSISLDRWVPR